VVAVGDGGPDGVGAVGDVEGSRVGPVWWTGEGDSDERRQRADCCHRAAANPWPSGDVVWARPWVPCSGPWRVLGVLGRRRLAVPGGLGSIQYVAVHAGDDVAQPFKVRPAGGDRPLVARPAVGAVGQRQRDQGAGHHERDEDGHPRCLGVLGSLGSRTRRTAVA
jgi:hypothetical protein